MLYCIFLESHNHCAMLLSDLPLPHVCKMDCGGLQEVLSFAASYASCWCTAATFA